MSKKYSYKEATLENFLLFKGDKNTITFPEEKLITIINGDNMTGKTSILKFFYWMFFSADDIDTCFNTILELIPNKNLSAKPISYLNSIYLKDGVDEYKIGGKIILDIKSDGAGDDGEYEISKYLIFNKDSSGNVRPVKLDIKIIDPNYLTLDEIQILAFFGEIGKEFPPEIRNFIFVPSETLGNLFQEVYYGKIREFSIHRSELPFLDKIYQLVSFFIDLSEYYINMEENKTKALKDINEVIEKLKIEKEKKNTEKTELSKKIDEENAELHSIETQIKTLFKSKDTRDKWIKIQEETKKLNGEKEKAENQLSQFLKKNAVKIYLYDEMKFLKEDLDSRDDFPHFFDKNIAKKILDNIKDAELKICPVCGGDLDKSDAIDHLDAYINSLIDKPGADTEIAIRFKTKLDDELNSIETNVTDLEVLFNSVESLKKDLEAKSAEELSLSNQLTEKEKSADYAKKYENLVKLKKVKEQLIRKQKIDVSKIDTEIKDLDKKIGVNESKKKGVKTTREKISTEEGKWKEVKTTFEIILKILDSLIRPAYEEKIKKKIINKTKEICQFIFDIPSEDLEINIKEVELGGVTKKLGWMIEFDEGLYDSSNGQEIILIISYIISIFETLNIKIPLFLDAPFSVLDDEFSERLASVIAKLGEKQQFIITMLNKMLTKPVKDIFGENECNKYSLIPIVRRFHSEIKNIEKWG